MNTKVYQRKLLPVLVLSVMACFITTSFVNARLALEVNQDIQNPEADGGVIQADEVVPGGPGFIMVNGMDFRPYTMGAQWAYLNSSLYNTGPVDYSYGAGLTLPHGAVITKMTMYYRDNVEPADLYLTLYRSSADSTLSILASILTEGTMPAIRFSSTTTFLNDPAVDNQIFSYWLSAYFEANGGMNLMLTNVRIDYAYPSNLPLVLK